MNESIKVNVQYDSLGRLSLNTYDTTLHWPAASEFVIRRTHQSYDELLPVQYIFDGCVPTPDNIPVRDLYYTGRGILRQKINIVGHGLTFEEAENVAYSKYAKILACEHQWYRNSQLDGSCSCCGECKIFVPHLQQDEKLFNAMNLAHEAHDGQYRKYTGEPYITHPQLVYSCVVFWKTLPEKQGLLMGKAAWLHDVLEDCPKITKDRIISETDVDTYNLVLELTNPSKGVKASREVRKKMDRDHLSHVSWEAKVIKLFDRTANLYDMKNCPEKDFIRLYASESRLLLEALQGTDEGLEAKLLDRIVAAEKLSLQTV